MTVTHITSHVADAQARLLQQVSQGPRVRALVGGLVGQVQALEDALYAMGPARALAGATGTTLDSVGTLVGAPPRGGLTDAQYLPLIVGQIGINNSDGTIPALINIVTSLFSASSVFIKTPNSHNVSNRSAFITIGVGSPTLPASLYGIVWGLLTSALSAGVPVDHAYTFNAAGAFSMAGPQPWVKGFDDGSGTVGGGFAAGIYNNAAV